MWLARKLVGCVTPVCKLFFAPLLTSVSRSLHRHRNASLDFVAAPALAPPEVQVDAVLMAQYAAELAAASNAPLPDEDDGDLVSPVFFWVLRRGRGWSGEWLLIAFFWFSQ